MADDNMMAAAVSGISGITNDNPAPINLVESTADPEALIEQAEHHLRSIGVPLDDDQHGPLWRARRALILHELGNRS